MIHIFYKFGLYSKGFKNQCLKKSHRLWILGRSSTLHIIFLRSNSKAGLPKMHECSKTLCNIVPNVINMQLITGDPGGCLPRFYNSETLM